MLLLRWIFLSATSEVISLEVSYDEEIPGEEDQDWIGLFTGDDLVSFNPDIVAQDDAEEQFDDDTWTASPQDQVFDTDQVLVVPDEQEALDEVDDHWVLDRLLDAVFDTDQVISIPDEQELPPDEDDGLAQDVLADQVYDADQVLSVADEQAVEPDEDDGFSDAYGAVDPPPPPGNNEQITFVEDTQDVDFVPDDEADLWDAYAQVDKPTASTIFAVNKFFQIHVGALGVIPQNEAT